MFDIFTALLGIISFCALVSAVAKIILRPRKEWEVGDWLSEELEEQTDYKELRKENPHIWIN